MPPRTRPLPPYLPTLTDDLMSVMMIVFVYAAGSLLLWPFIFVISLLLIPLVSIQRLFTGKY